VGEDVEAARPIARWCITSWPMSASGIELLQGPAEGGVLRCSAGQNREKVSKDDVPKLTGCRICAGQPPDMFEPGQAKLIPAAQTLWLEVHYMLKEATKTRPTSGWCWPKKRLPSG